MELEVKDADADHGEQQEYAHRDEQHIGMTGRRHEGRQVVGCGWMQRRLHGPTGFVSLNRPYSSRPFA